MSDSPADCPCGSASSYRSCCQKIHENGAGLGTTAESLMRARYSAYGMDRPDFLLASWHPDHRPDSMGEIDASQAWHGLDIIDVAGGGPLDSNGEVEFKARFSVRGDFFELHERSSFTRVGGKWMYVDGYDPGEAGT